MSTKNIAIFCKTNSIFQLSLMRLLLKLNVIQLVTGGTLTGTPLGIMGTQDIKKICYGDRDYNANYLGTRLWK